MPRSRLIRWMMENGVQLIKVTKKLRQVKARLIMIAQLKLMTFKSQKMMMKTTITTTKKRK